jgi:hypothetical protein
MANEDTKVAVLVSIVGGLAGTVMFLVVGTAIEARLADGSDLTNGSAYFLLVFGAIYLVALIIGLPISLVLVHVARWLKWSIRGTRRGMLLGAALGSVGVTVLASLHPHTSEWPAAMALFLGYELSGVMIGLRTNPPELT